MKPLSLVVLIAGSGLVLGGVACSRQAPEPAAPTKVTSATEDATRTEREQLFGTEALSPDVHWRENGFGYRIIQEGTPPKPGIGTPVRILYTGRRKDGAVFDRAEKPRDFQIGATIPGLSTGLQLLGTGGKAVFYIPPSLGYGSRKVMGIPPNSGLIFEVEVVAVNP